jgi:hypothetical protein
MRLLLTTICFLLLLPINAFPARLIVTVPQGITEVEILSKGTLAVLDHLKERLNSGLKEANNRYQLNKLESELKASALKVVQSDMAYKEKIDSLRKQYIAKVPITIHSANAQITKASALGEISFTYTVHNNSDKIISDIIYKPLIGNTPLPITTMLVLEFINSKNLISGLAPGESLTNQGSDLEHLSFFLSELTDKDINRIKASMPGGFSFDVTDIHFVSQKGYKGQTKVMDVKEAFADVLKAYQGASMRAHDENKEKTGALATAKGLFERDTKGTISDFKTRSNDLKKASRRYKGDVDPKKNRATIQSIKPGKYYVYATSTTGKAIFEEITIEEGNNKIKIETQKKDPFEP